MKNTAFNPHVIALSQLIAAGIRKEPFICHGQSWCAMPQPEMASTLGISVETLRRLISKPPFIRLRSHKDGKPVTLLRTGEPEPKTKKLVQNHLANIWRKKTGRQAHYGHLAGMVDAWGLDKAPDILRLILKDWPRFMAGAHIEIEKLGDDGYKRFYKHPSTSVILRFNTVASDMYLTDQQEKDGLNADYGGLWFAP